MGKLFEKFNINLDETSIDEINIIGLDFGDGEFSGAVYGYHAVKNKYDCIRLFVDSGQSERKIITAVYIPFENENNYLIGKQALDVIKNSKLKNNGRLYTNFKCKPSMADEEYEVEGELDKREKIYTHKQLMQMFFKKAIENLFEFNKDILNKDKKSIILIGRPAGSDESDWGMQEKKYASIFAEALKDNEKFNIIVLSESLAAMSKIFCEEKLRKDCGVAVIDIGSSTIDMTYCINNEVKAELSYTLGAGRIEKNIWKCLKEINNIDNINISNDILSLRIIKENYYGVDGHGQDEQFFTYVLNKTPYSYLIDKTIMNKSIYNITEKVKFKTGINSVEFKSWYDGFLDFFKETAKKIGQNGGQLSEVILTGGGSNMPFVRQLCESFFGKDAKVSCETEPNYTVSDGLALVGYTEIQADIHYNEVKPQIETILDDIDKLQTEIARSIVRDMLENIYYPNLRLWRDGSFCKLEDVKIKINEQISNWLISDEFKTKLKEVFEIWYKENIEEKISEAVNKKYELLFSSGFDYKFKISNSIVNKLYNKVSQISINVDAKSIMNKSLGFLKGGNVNFSKEHDKDSRRRKIDRAVYRELDLKEEYIKLIKNQINDVNEEIKEILKTQVPDDVKAYIDKIKIYSLV